MISSVKISVCIPAYNRPNQLVELLESIERQNYAPYEVIVCEDNSPERVEISNIIQSYGKRSKLYIRYFENDKNLGYDANLRKTISLAKGDYVFLSGNDDLLAENSLEIIANKISRYSPNVIIRSYASFYKYSSNSRTEHKYVKKDCLVNFSNDEAAWLFYRSVLVSGLVFKVDLAHLLQSDIVDGTLYYQNYLLTKIFRLGPALYVPDIIVHNRLMDAGDFGSSEIEAKGGWEPGKRTVRSSVFQMQKFFECARQTEEECQTQFSSQLKKIASAYSYPLIAYHADKAWKDYFGYILSLRELGYGGLFFYCYAFSLKFLGVRFSNKIISCARMIFGHTKKLV